MHKRKIPCTPQESSRSLRPHPNAYAIDNGGSVPDTASYLEIDPRLVESALQYYGANREEIDDWIARIQALNEREEAKWRAAQEAISS